MPKQKKKSFPVIAFFFIIIPALTIVIAFAKIAKKETKYIYAKIKVSQGLWWASTAKPNLWLGKNIKKGEIEYNLLGKPIAEILEVRYYPFFSEMQTSQDRYNVYLKVKLAASYNQRTQKYTFKRSSLVVGAPIEIETQSTQITGTITELSEHEFDEERVEKTILLTKKFTYPWEYETIKIGDSYFDGEETVFEVLDKYQVGAIIVTSDLYGNVKTTVSNPYRYVPPSTVDQTKYLVVKARIKAQKKDGQLLFGEEKVINSGSTIAVFTPHFNFEDFIVSKIEN